MRRGQVHAPRHRQADTPAQPPPGVFGELLQHGAAYAPARGRVVEPELRKRAPELLQRLLVVPRAVQRGADLARQRRALRRVEPIAEGLQVRRLGLAEVFKCFGVGGHAAGQITGLEQVLLRLVPILGAGVVVGQQAREFVEASLEQHLDRLRHAPVDRAPVLGEDAAVGGLVHQRVLEDVFDLRQALPLADQLRMLELRDARFKRTPRRADDLQHPVEEAAADHRSELERLLHLFIEAVDPCQDQALHRVGQVHLIDLPDDLPRLVFRAAHQHAIGDQRADDFFDEQRVALGLAQDLFAQRRRQVRCADEVRHQQRALLFRQRQQRDLAQVPAGLLGGKPADVRRRAGWVWPGREEGQQRRRVGER